MYEIQELFTFTRYLAKEYFIIGCILAVFLGAFSDIIMDWLREVKIKLLW